MTALAVATPKNHTHRLVATWRRQGMSEPAISRALGYTPSDDMLAPGPTEREIDDMENRAPIIDEPEMVKIVIAVAGAFKVEPKEVFSDSRRGDRDAVPRQVAMYLIRQEVEGVSLERIAAFFERHHTTVIHALVRAEEILKSQKALRVAIHKWQGLDGA